ncbi:MAG: hypothetical protein J5710_14035 [Treponema sp.]|nr:hypothetical protein [Treponema sp.]
MTNREWLENKIEKYLVVILIFVNLMLVASLFCAFLIDSLFLCITVPTFLLCVPLNKIVLDEWLDKEHKTER